MYYCIVFIFYIFSLTAHLMLAHNTAITAMLSVAIYFLTVNKSNVHCSL